MMFSDKCSGTVGLCASLLFLGYLLMRLIVLPILPLDDENIFKVETPTGLLLILGFMGFMFIGLLSAYMLYILCAARVRGGSEYNRD